MELGSSWEGTRLVVIESPFKGEGVFPFSWIRKLLNIRYARACMHHSLSLGEAPFASHLLYTQPGVLRDRVTDDRRHGINAGFAWGLKAHARIIYYDRGVSAGMWAGVQEAARIGQPLVYRTLKKL